MNASLTIDTLSFVQQYSEKSGSLRREIARGPALPTELKIAHQPYVDSATKLPGTRSVVRFDRYQALSTGVIAPVSAYLVVTRPTDTLVTGTEILATIQNLVSLLQEDDSGLDLMDEIFVNQEQ
uniref:Uncharacterized protein n=1 Tax=Leviviridae sp. TaxID=2027243 RepID=A0A514DAI6_9VIRU|nr:MAG: hypothetical protein H1RhizoLitter245_000003 [Leviviridae sp.]